MIPVADPENFGARRSLRRQARPRGTEPNAAAIEGRGAYARAKIKQLHGYGKREISELIALEKSGLNREELAIRFRLEEWLIADLLAQAASRELLKRQKLARKPSRLEPRPPKPRLPKPRPPKKIKKLPEKEILLELYQDVRVTKKAILGKLKINNTTLYDALLRYGIPLRRARFRQRFAEREKALRQMFLTEKLSPQEIADRLLMSLKRVRKFLRLLNDDDEAPLREN